jgi:uncharacterized protein (DUF1330 family)
MGSSLHALRKYCIRWTAPKRFVIIGFESVDKAKAWDASPAQKEVNDIRMKNTKSRSFIAAVEGM